MRLGYGFLVPCVILSVASGVSHAAGGWPGALETDAPIAVALEVRFAKGAQIAPDGSIQLDAILPKASPDLYWLIEGAGDETAQGDATALARAEAVKIYLVERNIPPQQIVAFGLPGAIGPKARVRAFSGPPGPLALGFAPGLAEIDQAGRNTLDFLAASLARYDRALMIQAFATPSQDGNALPLAIARAQAVRNYLLGRGVPGHRLEITAEAVNDALGADRVQVRTLSR